MLFYKCFWLSGLNNMDVDNGLVTGNKFSLSGAATQSHTKKLVIKNLKGNFW